MKPFHFLSSGASHNVQSFCDQYVKLMDRVVELEKVSHGVDMISQVDMERLRVICSLCKMKRLLWRI